MTENFRKDIHRTRRQRELLTIPLDACAPLGESCKRVLRKIAHARPDPNFIAEHGAQITARNHLAVLDEHYLIASNFDFAEQVKVQENDRVAIALHTDHITHQPPPHWVEPGGGLVEKNQL